MYVVLGRFNSEDWDEDDRVSEAMYVLGRAVSRFNPWKGFRFSTYACNAICPSLDAASGTGERYRRLFPMQLDGLLERPSKEHSFGTRVLRGTTQLAFTDNRRGSQTLRRASSTSVFLLSLDGG